MVDNYKQKAYDLYKELIPTNARAAIKSLAGNQDTITGSYFTNRELDALRDAVLNREAYIKAHGGKREFSYDDYAPLMVGNKQVAPAPFLKNEMATRVNNYSYNRPNYRAQTTVGSARYFVDPGGNVSVYDTYDVNKGTNMADWYANIPHTLVKHFGKPYEVRIDLGNMKRWK